MRFISARSASTSRSHLDHGSERVSRRREPLWAALFRHGGWNGNGGVAGCGPGEGDLFASLLWRRGVGIGCALAAIMPNFWAFAVMLVIVGMAALTFANSSNSLMQLATEPAMRAG
ncbi:MAG: hypothetical protein WDM89_12615 [Rhizomicrobium sp.]